MRDKCIDVFAEYNLPLETYFFECQNHEISAHKDLEIIWVLKGKAYLEVAGIEYEMVSKTVFLVYHNKEHSLKTEKGTIVIAYRLNNDYLHQRGLFFERIPYQGRVHTFEYLADKYRQVPLLLVQFLKLLLSNANQEIIYYKIVAYYNFYVNEIYNILLKERYLDVKTIDYDEYLIRSQKIVQFIENNYHKQIELNDLKEILKLSKSRISHFIKETFGLSFQDFLQNVRLNHAIRLIIETDQPIAHISESSGFSDQKYLNKLMKKQFSKTALQYRKSYKKPLEVNNRFSSKNYNFIQEIRKCLKNLEEDKRFKVLFEIEPII